MQQSWYLYSPGHKCIQLITWLSQVHHALSSSNDLRIEEGGIVKIDAYDTVMALVNNPDVYDEEFIKKIMEWYKQ